MHKSIRTVVNSKIVLLMVFSVLVTSLSTTGPSLAQANTCSGDDVIKVSVDSDSNQSFNVWIRAQSVNADNQDVWVKVADKCSRIAAPIKAGQWSWVKVSDKLNYIQGKNELSIYTSKTDLWLDKILSTVDNECNPNVDENACLIEPIELSLYGVEQGQEINEPVAIYAESASLRPEDTIVLSIDGTPQESSTKLSDSIQCLAKVEDNRCANWDPATLSSGKHSISASIVNRGRSVTITRDFTVNKAPAPAPAPNANSGSTVEPQPAPTPPEDPNAAQSEPEQKPSENSANQTEDEVVASPETATPSKPNPETAQPKLKPVVVVDTKTISTKPLSGKVILSPSNPAAVSSNAKLSYTIDDEVVATTTGEAPQAEIDTILIDDGLHTIELTTTEPTGEVNQTSITTKVDNSFSNIAAQWIGRNMYIIYIPSVLFGLGAVFYCYLIFKRRRQFAFSHNAEHINYIHPTVYDRTKAAYPVLAVAVLAFTSSGLAFAGLDLFKNTAYSGNSSILTQFEDSQLTTFAKGIDKDIAYASFVLKSNANTNTGSTGSGSGQTSTAPNPVPNSSTPKSAYVENLNRIKSATYRNRLHDNSQYMNTRSDDLPINNFLVNWREYSNPILNTSTGLLNGLPKAGQFRMSCEFSHFAYDDPIVFPGKPGVSHLHMFFGNTDANAHSTYDSIVNSGSSTCNGQELNRTSYWVPAMFDEQGNARVPERLLTYYKSYNSAVGKTNVYPPGMALIAGNAMTTQQQPNTTGQYPYISFRCAVGSSGSGPKSPTIPKCDADKILEMNVHFQTCWNGKDPSNYKANAAFALYNSATGLCPETHTLKLPQMEYRIFFPDHNGQSDKWFLSSDVDVATSSKLRIEPGLTIHGDWWGGWNQEINKRWIDNCNNVANAECADGLLGDPRIANEPKGLKIRPEYRGPLVLPGKTIRDQLCPNPSRPYVNKYSPAMCDTSVMMSNM